MVIKNKLETEATQENFKKIFITLNEIGLPDLSELYSKEIRIIATTNYVTYSKKKQ